MVAELIRMVLFTPYHSTNILETHTLVLVINTLYKYLWFDIMTISFNKNVIKM